MMNWNDLQYVLALRDGGTIKQAANLLGTDPTTVSRHIKRISADFGETLFNMNKGKDWTLTARGEELTRLAESFKAGLDSLNLDQVAGVENESVTITSLEFMLTYYLAPRLASGLARFPDTRISLLGTDKRLSLAYGEADIALRFGRPTEGQLLASKIADVDFEIFAPAGARPDKWIGLSEELDWTPEMQMAIKHFGKAPSLRVSSYASAREAAAATGYAAVGPAVIMRDGDVLETCQDAAPVVREVWSVIHESQKLNRLLADVRTWIKEAVAETQRRNRIGYRSISATPNLRGSVC